MISRKDYIDEIPIGAKSQMAFVCFVPYGRTLYLGGQSPADGFDALSVIIQLAETHSNISVMLCVCLLESKLDLTIAIGVRRWLGLVYDIFKSLK